MSDQVWNREAHSKCRWLYSCSQLRIVHAGSRAFLITFTTATAIEAERHKQALPRAIRGPS